MTLPGGARRAVLTTDASSLAVAAILTQPDDGGRWHPVACERRKLTAAERNYPVHVLELLAVHSPRSAGVSTLAARRSGASARGLLDGFRPADRQRGDHVAQDEPTSELYARWLDEIEDFLFDLTHHA